MLSVLFSLFLNSLVHSIAIYESDLNAIPFIIEHKEIAIAKSIEGGVGNSVGGGNQAVAFLPATEFATTLYAVIQIGVPAQPVVHFKRFIIAVKTKLIFYRMYFSTLDLVSFGLSPPIVKQKAVL
jgi:hypothetical protein